MTCKECPGNLNPSCSIGIPCCLCNEENCNCRQPCPKKENEADDKVNDKVNQ